MDGQTLISPGQTSLVSTAWWWLGRGADRRTTEFLVPSSGSIIVFCNNQSTMDTLNGKL